VAALTLPRPRPAPPPLPSNPPSALQNNTQQAAGFLGQYDDPGSDLKSFFSEYYKPGIGRRPKIVGPNDANNAGDEASLDVQ
jgi:hypothetical protein